MWRDVAIPTLPARDLDETIAFYDRLGFSVAYQEADPEPYLILARGDLELHFFVLEGLNPAESYSGCYIRVHDAEGLYGEYAALGLPEDGIPGVSALENKPWGTLEFHVIDPSGNLLRVSQPTDARFMA